MCSHLPCNLLIILGIVYIGVVVWIIHDDVKSIIKDVFAPCKEKPNSDETTDTPENIHKTYNNPYIQQYYDALDKKDRDAMIEALEECKAHCSGANSLCLTELFCPDCPISGAITVYSGRAEFKL